MVPHSNLKLTLIESLVYIMIFKNILRPFKLTRESLGYFPLGVCACALPPAWSVKLAPLIASFIQAFGLFFSTLLRYYELLCTTEEPGITFIESASGENRCVACTSRRASPPWASFSVRSNKEGFELSFRPAVLAKSGANGGKLKTGRRH